MDCETLGEFEKKPVALLGDKKICKHIYLQYRSVLDIKYIFMTNMDYGEYASDDFFLGLTEVKCVPLKRRMVEEQGLFLILCKPSVSRKNYDDLLHYQGFEWGEDYLDYLWVIQFYRHKYREDLTERELWIFGAGNTGRRFYEQFGKSYGFKGFISNNEEEREFLGLPVVRPDYLLERKNVYIIVCSVAEKEISDQLMQAGLTAYDYGFPDTIPKKLLISMGTCQVVNTVRILRKNTYFSGLYDACYYFDTIYDPCNDADSKRLKGYGNFCDVVFYNIANAGTSDIRNYEPLLNKYYSKAVRLYMPFYCFRGQVPQATKEENRYELESGWVWVRGDKEINRMVEKGYTEDEILENISGNDYWTREWILENFRDELEMVSVWDRFSSFPIRPFIENNYRKIQVFIDGTHFSYHLHLHLANEIAKYVQAEPIDHQEIIDKIEREQHSVMPVYPCVRKALGMEKAKGYKFWNMERNETEYLSFEEHIKRYIRYVVNVRNICQESGTHFLF